MIFKIAVVVVGMLAAAGFMTLAAAQFAESMTSKDAKVRRRGQLVEAALGFTTLLFWGATTQSVKERRLALVTIAVIAAAWLFRAARVLFNRRRA